VVVIEVVTSVVVKAIVEVTAVISFMGTLAVTAETWAVTSLEYNLDQIWSAGLAWILLSSRSAVEIGSLACFAATEFETVVSYLKLLRVYIDACKIDIAYISRSIIRHKMSACMIGQSDVFLFGDSTLL
jgi:hypothetical protein